MSHTVEIKTNISNFQLLDKSLENFGWRIVEKTKARTYRNDPARETIYDYVAVNPQDGYDLGINLIDGEYKIYGDFYDSSIAQQLGENLDSLKQRYSFELTKAYFEEEELEYEINTTDEGIIEFCLN